MDLQKILLRALASVPAALHTSEALFGDGNGAQKKQAALEAVAAVIDLGEAASNNHVIDAQRFTAGLGTIIDGVVECLNASVWARP